MKNINEIIISEKCTGCGACVNVCPINAISMVENNEGFLVPKIDKNKCTGCGLCNRICPMLNEISRNDQYSIPKVYAGWNKNEKIRLRSSSGGVFSLLAEYFLKKKGYVCGAAFDDKNHLRHIIISNKKDLQKLRGSKYVQSEIGNVLKDVKKILDSNKWVLFSGTPCQIAGLKLFLKKDYEKLLTVDLVCHGVPSPKVFEKYISEIEKEKNSKINSINFRDKSTGWKDYSFLLSNNKKKILKCNYNDDLYFKGFLENLFLNEVCTSCPFSKFPKSSDITLGDYWGIENYKKSLDDNKGISVLIINNQKGLNILESINKTKKIFLEKVNKCETLRKIFSIYLPCQAHQNRESLFKGISTGDISKKVNKELHNNIDFDIKNVAILCMRFPTDNYGAILQSFALSQTIKKMGYKPKVINYISKELDNDRDKISLLSLDKFREENINYTLPCYSKEDLIKLNKNFNTFIVGSDQVWNYNYLNWAYKDDIGRYFLNFVLPSKNVFSYAASLAENHWNGDKDEIKIVANCLKKFSNISVREKSSVNICKRLFGVEVERMLDPTLLLTENEYKNVINSENIKRSNDKYIGYFAIDENLEKNIILNNKLEDFVNQNKWKLKNIRGLNKKILSKDKFIYNSIPDWINYIKNAELVITDSYHCVIFSIIFKKQFCVIPRSYAGNDRLISLLSLFEIHGKLFNSLEDVDFIELMKNKINYKNVYKKIKKEKNKSLKFLKDSLDNNISEVDKIERIENEFIEISRNNSFLKDQGVLFSQLTEKIQFLESNNFALQEKVNELNLAIDKYLSTKTFKYAKKIKKILLKIGIKKFKL